MDIFCKAFIISAIFFMSLGTAKAASPEQQGTYHGIAIIQTYNLATGKIEKSEPYDMSIKIAADDKADINIGEGVFTDVPAAIGIKHGGFSVSFAPNSHTSVIFSFAGKGKSIKGLLQFASSSTLQIVKFKLKKI